MRFSLSPVCYLDGWRSIYVILHPKGVKYVNADALSRVPDDFIACDCYRAGVSPTDLPCCNTCTQAHQQWSRFKDGVDDGVPLFVHLVSMNSMEEHCILVQDTTESPDESQSVRVRQIGVVGAIIANPDEWQVCFSSKYTHQK